MATARGEGCKPSIRQLVDTGAAPLHSEMMETVKDLRAHIRPGTQDQTGPVTNHDRRPSRKWEHEYGFLLGAKAPLTCRRRPPYFGKRQEWVGRDGRLLMEPYYKWDPEKEAFVASPVQERENPVDAVFRLATDADRTAILDFEAEYERGEPQSFLRATGFQDFRTGLWSADLGALDQTAVAVAVVGGKVVGELPMSHYDDRNAGTRVGVIRGICVLKPYRQAGIGRRLFDIAKDQFRRWGASKIELMYGLRNLADQEFCRRLGFEIPRTGYAVYHLT